MQSKKLKDFANPKPTMVPEYKAENRYFEPNETIAWIICNTDYDAIQDTGEELFSDKPTAFREAERMTSFYKRLGFQKIIVTENPLYYKLEEVYKELEKTTQDIHKLYREHKKERRKPESEQY